MYRLDEGASWLPERGPRYCVNRQFEVLPGGALRPLALAFVPVDVVALRALDTLTPGHLDTVPTWEYA